jgi:hypothetical protein
MDQGSKGSQSPSIRGSRASKDPRDPGDPRDNQGSKDSGVHKSRGSYRGSRIQGLLGGGPRIQGRPEDHARM